MMTRITIAVTVEEREALRRLAIREKRDPRDLARLYIRQALLAGSNATPPTPQQPEQAAIAGQ